MESHKKKRPRGVAIVELNPEEWRKFKKLSLQALREEPVAFAVSYGESKGRPDGEWMAKLIRSADSKEFKLLFAKKRAELAGMAEIRFDLTKKRAHIAKFANIFVSKKFRGQGIGAKMIAAAIRYIRRKHHRIVKIALSVDETMSAAMALYRRLGFKIIGRAIKEVRIDKNFYDRVLMEKILK